MLAGASSPPLRYEEEEEEEEEEGERTAGGLLISLVPRGETAATSMGWLQESWPQGRRRRRAGEARTASPGTRVGHGGAARGPGPARHARRRKTAARASSENLYMPAATSVVVSARAHPRGASLAQGRVWTRSPEVLPSVPVPRGRCAVDTAVAKTRPPRPAPTRPLALRRQQGLPRLARPELPAGGHERPDAARPEGQRRKGHGVGEAPGAALVSPGLGLSRLLRELRGQGAHAHRREVATLQLPVHHAIRAALWAAELHPSSLRGTRPPAAHAAHFATHRLHLGLWLLRCHCFERAADAGRRELVAALRRGGGALRAAFLAADRNAVGLRRVRAPAADVSLVTAVDEDLLRLLRLHGLEVHLLEVHGLHRLEVHWPLALRLRLLAASCAQRPEPGAL